jgi:hypothetical protein
LRPAVLLHRDTELSLPCLSLHSLIHSLAHSLTLSLTRSLAHSLGHSLTHSLTRSLTHSLAHSLSRSLAHSLAHSLPSCNHQTEHQLATTDISSSQVDVKSYHDIVHVMYIAGVCVGKIPCSYMWDISSVKCYCLLLCVVCQLVSSSCALMWGNIAT